jgi:Fic family protein
MTREYILMNRDLPVLRFACERNAFDEPEFTETEWLTELRPIGYGKLNDFLSRRQPPNTASTLKNCWSVTAATIWRAFSASPTPCL